MKFTRSAPVRIGHISQVDYFVTDRPPPESDRRHLLHNGVTLEVVRASTPSDDTSSGD